MTCITSEEAGNFLEQEDRLLLAPPELTQQHRSTNSSICRALPHRYVSLYLYLQDNHQLIDALG